MVVFRIIVTAFLLLVVLPYAGQTEAFSVKKTDKCPVCGMFVAKYPDFITQITFSDESYAVFDGVKDMFKYYFGLNKYNAAKKLPEITAVSVTDYYEMTPIDGRTAIYVIGSDVFGPMGHELIPFSHEKDAAVFMKDHAGKKMLHFEEVTPALIENLD